MSQQLKVGQVWKDREGNEVTITQGGYEGGYPFDGDNGETYTDMGYVWEDPCESPQDLIELIRDVPDESSEPTLKVGQVWRDRAGNEVTIIPDVGRDTVYHGSTELFPFRGSNNQSYTTRGYVWEDPCESPQDLIELIRDVPDSDGWITWKGGECPVAGDTLVETRFWDDSTDITEAGDLRWGHLNLSGDIIAYRVVEQPAKSEQPAPNPEGWITWSGGECPVSGDALVEVKLHSQERYKCRAEGVHWGDMPEPMFRVAAYRVVEQPAKSEQRTTDSEGWIKWGGGACPVHDGTLVDVEYRDGIREFSLPANELVGGKDRDASSAFWCNEGVPNDILAYRIVDQPTESEQPAPNPKHAHYFKSVAHLDTVDVYRVCELFGVTDQAIGHAIKKLLCAGQRGVKDQRKDVQEAIDTLTRRVAMWQEDEATK